MTGSAGLLFGLLRLLLSLPLGLPLGLAVEVLKILIIVVELGQVGDVKGLAREVQLVRHEAFNELCVLVDLRPHRLLLALATARLLRN